MKPIYLMTGKHGIIAMADKNTGSTGMNIQINEQGNIVLISVVEERLDAHNSTDLKTRLLSLFEDGKNNMVINLEEVRFVDSSGLGALVSGFKNASARNGSLKLAGLQPQVQSMFELTRLHLVFEIFPTSEDALASFQP
jgi:anti-sigma B factor antagonist